MNDTLKMLQEAHKRACRGQQLSILENRVFNFKQELEYLGGQLREEAVRCERLEEQMNDLTELHQNEMEIIKVRFIMLKSETN